MRRFRRVYYPRKRQAYGPRQRRTLVEDYCSVAASKVPEWAHIERVQVPMPHGGARAYAVCPRCQRRCERLYDGPGPSYWLYVCRRCAGHVYWRQYEGRRPEADCGGLHGPERALWAMCRGYHGWHDALLTWAEREAQHGARAWLAITITRLRIEQMIAYHRRLDELNAAVERGESYHGVKRSSQHTRTILTLERRIRQLEHQYHLKAA